jgi:hypothetical protein
MKELIGRSLGQYKIVEIIGQGGMATVFKARQQGLERWVAVKVLPPHYAADPDFSRYFLREAQAIALLEHPHILPVYDFGQQDDYTYLVMRYIEGSRSLADVMRTAIPIEQALRYLEQMAAALDYAHDRGVIHRDIKPANILLSDDWVFLADFGIARIMRANAQLITTGITLGTPAYMSPEQGSGGSVGAPTDVYAVGVMAYALFTGRIPHLAESTQAIIYKRNYEPPPSLREFRPEAPIAVDRVIQKALAPQPAKRYQRTGAFIAALAQTVRETKVTHLRTAPVRDVAYLPPAAPVQPPPLPSTRHTSCPNCNAIIVPGAETCFRCGFSLVEQTPAGATAPPSPHLWRMAALIGTLVTVILLGILGAWLLARQLDLSLPAAQGRGPDQAGPGDRATALPTRTVAETLFLDDFDGVGIDRSRWGFDIGGGQLQVFDSNLRLSSAGQSYPVVYTLSNPFPETGDFRVRLEAQYLSTAERGSGVILGVLPDVAQVNQNRSLLQNGQIIGIWQDSQSWRVAAAPDDVAVYTLPGPELETFEIEIDYVDNVYVVKLAGEVVYISDPVTERPNGIWLGNPLQTAAGSSWSSLTVDLIAVEVLTDRPIAAAPTPTPTVSEPTATPTALPTPTSTSTPLGQNCESGIDNIFSDIWQEHRHLLGCPEGNLKLIPTIAEEVFQSGHLFWRNDTEQVYIILDRRPDGQDLNEGKWGPSHPSWKWDGSQPEGLGLSPPPGLVEPKRGFGWLWRTHLGGPQGPLGWALDKEYGFDNLGQAQNFEQGVIFKGSSPKIYVLLDNGTFYAERGTN